VNSVETPVHGAFSGHFAFVPTDEERCSSSSVGRFDFDESLFSIEVERQNVESGTVAILGSHPPYSARKILAFNSDQAVAPCVTLSGPAPLRRANQSSTQLAKLRCTQIISEVEIR
jgi:hypothetical protein